MGVKNDNKDPIEPFEGKYMTMPCRVDIGKVRVLETEDEFNHLIDQLETQSLFSVTWSIAQKDHFLG